MNYVMGGHRERQMSRKMEEEVCGIPKGEMSGDSWRVPTEASADGNLRLFVEGLFAIGLGQGSTFPRDVARGKERKPKFAPTSGKVREGAPKTGKTK